jgi:ABC-type lipoprotein export system ATPase subunit
MKKLNREKKQTFIVVTHDQSIAKEATRTIYVRDGLIEEIRENKIAGSA